MAEGKSGIGTALIAAIAALAGAFVGPWIKKDSDIELARQKFYSDLVMKSLEQKTGEERIEMLKMLTQTHLISDETVRKGIEQYASTITPANVPQVTPSGSFPAPIVSDPRIFLLAGTSQKASGFDTLRSELTNANYRVLDAKVLSDAGRPDGREIRYFNPDDGVQASKIADYLKLKDPGNPIPTKLIEDRSARPGYIEIWLGR